MSTVYPITAPRKTMTLSDRLHALELLIFREELASVSLRIDPTNPAREKALKELTRQRLDASLELHELLSALDRVADRNTNGRQAW